VQSCTNVYDRFQEKCFLLTLQTVFYKQLLILCHDLYLRVLTEK
jgi:hypothetical protein